MKMYFSFVMAMVIFFSKASHQDLQADTMKIVACGQILAVRRAEVCYGVEKRNGGFPQLDAVESSNKLDDYSWPIMDRHSAIQWFRNKRSGLVDECCFKPCTIDEIRNYC